MGAMTRRLSHARLALGYADHLARSLRAEVMIRGLFLPSAQRHPLFIGLVRYRERCARRALQHARAVVR